MREEDMTTIEMLEYLLTVVDFTTNKLSTVSSHLNTLKIDEEMDAEGETLTSCEIGGAYDNIDSAITEMLSAYAHIKRAIKDQEKER